MKRHMLGVQEGFFDQSPRQSSRVKRQIVTEYFDYYMRVMARNGRTAGYVDLFAGPGSYGNGEESIPLIIARQVTADPRLRDSVKLWFNEGNPDHFQTLKKNLDAVVNIGALVHKPRITPHLISDSFAPKLYGMRTPSFVFADPCGYKGLSLRLISAALRPYGNDCIFFLNYNRINMKISYETMNESINDFFEATLANKLRAEIKSLGSPQERERLILAAVTGTLEQQADAKCLTFGFRTRGEGGGTSHHLVYATKNLRALNQMKRIYTKASSDQTDGVGSLDYDPTDAGSTLPLFSPLENVRRRVLETYCGRTLTFDELVAEEAAATTFTDTAYRNALCDLENEKKVIMEPSAESRRFQAGGIRRSLPGATRITFPNCDN
jgi:three-Cys-motif partner protein